VSLFSHYLLINNSVVPSMEFEGLNLHSLFSLGSPVESEGTAGELGLGWEGAWGPESARSRRPSETQRRPEGVGNGGFPPFPTKESGERHEIPQQGPARNRFIAFQASQTASRWDVCRKLTSSEVVCRWKNHSIWSSRRRGDRPIVPHGSTHDWDANDHNGRSTK